MRRRRHCRRADLGVGRDTELAQGPHQFQLQQVHRPLRAISAAGPNAKGHSPAREREVCPQSLSAQNIGAAPHSAVENDLDPAAESLGNGWKCLDRRRPERYLAPAVVGNDDPVAVPLGALKRVLRVQDALDDQLSLPPVAKPLEMFPHDLESYLPQLRGCQFRRA